MSRNKITLNHGSGGRQMHEFISKLIMKKLGNGVLERMDDSAVLENHKAGRIAMTTDSFVVSPLFFEGGDIGTLAVCGTVNDLATSGAKPYALSLAFILEEGIEFKTIERIVDSIAETAKKADVKIVTGDTKVVERGKGDQIYINTCGIGYIEDGVEVSTYNANVGDSVIVTGPLGNHEVSLMKARGIIEFEVDVKSDAAPLNKGVEQILKDGAKLNVVKDPTRGGLASALHEVADHSKKAIRIYEEKVPVDREVHGVCELVGFDPLYLSNEGKYLIVCPKESVESVLKAYPEAKEIGVIEEMTGDKPEVLLENDFGGERRLGMLETTQLPRIC